MKIVISSEAIAPHIEETKAFADGRWRENPWICAQAWRDGWAGTVSRLWLDGRLRWSESELMAAHEAGANGLVVSAEHWPEYREYLAINRAEWVVLVQVEHLEKDVFAGVDGVVWQPKNEPTVAEFAWLEAAVREGCVGGYGIVVPEPLNMVAWWELARRGAEQAWGRRKKPSWRVLMGELGVGQDALLHASCCPVGGEIVSVLEWAARLGLMVVADGGSDVFGPAGERMLVVEVNDDERFLAAKAVETIVLLEQQLMAALGGWPLREGVPVFSLLMHVQRTVPLWPGEVAWQRWWGVVWPELKLLWQQIEDKYGEHRPEIAVLVRNYVQAVAELAPLANVLMVAGAQQWQRQVMRWLRGEVPFNSPAWAGVSDTMLRALLIASLPAVTGVVGRWSAEEIKHGMACANVVGVDRFFVS